MTWVNLWYDDQMEFRSYPNPTCTPFTKVELFHAWHWLIKSRQHFPANADIWHLRYNWESEWQDILSSVNNGRYYLSPLHVVNKSSEGSVAIWSSRDALVIKMLTARLTKLLPVHQLCEHIKTHGGGKQSALRVHRYLQREKPSFVYRTDIKGYYANIDKQRLYAQICQYVTEKHLTLLLWQFLHYSVEEGGNFHTPRKGISRGSALSPLLAAFHLYELDKHFGNQTRVRYARYMDDFLLLAQTRRYLRRAISELKRFLFTYGFTLHPDKTQLGRTTCGFDWMSLWFNSRGIVRIAPRAVEKHRLQLRRLYERVRRQPRKGQEQRMALYRKRWFSALVPVQLNHVVPDYDEVTVKVVAMSMDSPGVTVLSSG